MSKRIILISAAAIVLIAVIAAVIIDGAKNTETPDAAEDTTPSETAPTEESKDIYETGPAETETETETPTQTLSPFVDMEITIAGDVELASNHNDFYGRFSGFLREKESEYYFANIKHLFEGDDFTLIDFENVLSDKPLAEAYKDYDPAYWYMTETKNVKIITCASIEGVSLANNHIMDYGDEGYYDTVETLRNEGVMIGDDSNILYYTKEGFTVAFICRNLWGYHQLSYAREMLEEASEKSDFQVIYMHGGDMQSYPEYWKVDCARALVDAGADLVIGSHPHKIQPMEVYNGVDIVYSISDLLAGDLHMSENKTIVYKLYLTFDRETRELTEKRSELIPCYQYPGSEDTYDPGVIEDEERKNAILEFMYGGID